MPENHASFRLVNNVLGGRERCACTMHIAVISWVQLKANTLTADRHVGKNGATRTSFYIKHLLGLGLDKSLLSKFL